MNNNKTRVFISYCWENGKNQESVRKFADQLLKDGVEAIIDQYDLNLGDRLPYFMEKSITDADFVLIICTPSYKEKSDSRLGGVGYEGHIISGELLKNQNEKKFIPIIFSGDIKSSVPNFLSGKLAIDFTDIEHNDDHYKDLLTTLFRCKVKPKVGEKPSYINRLHNLPAISHGAESLNENDEIKVLGIITDEVTIPKMDGTKGSALYSIPFRLSQYPDSEWSKIFIENWDNPPAFTTMHRPGIASIVGDKIILNGTTIEEVRDYHRETLLLCVNKTNKTMTTILTKQRRRDEEEKKRKEKHYKLINDIATEIQF